MLKIQMKRGGVVREVEDALAATLVNTGEAQYVKESDAAPASGQTEWTAGYSPVLRYPMLVGKCPTCKQSVWKRALYYLTDSVLDLVKMSEIRESAERQAASLVFSHCGKNETVPAEVQARFVSMAITRPPRQKPLYERAQEELDARGAKPGRDYDIAGADVARVVPETEPGSAY